MPKKPEKPERDSVAREVDRLLKQLPGADPSLKSDPDQPPPRPQSARPPQGPRPPMPPRGPVGPQPLGPRGTWALVFAAGILGIALTQWPYASKCGFSLYAYLATILVLLVTAGWAAIAAWGIRSPLAHVLSLVIAFWGIVLAADQILPRVGYAAEQRWWACGSIPVPPAVAPVIHVVPRTAPDSVQADSGVVVDSAATGPDSQVADSQGDR
jgi:hypothetical protein